MADTHPEWLRLVLVTEDRLVGERDLLALCRAAVRGGVTAVQLRLKDAPPRRLIGVLRSLKAELRVPVLVNDRLDVALAGGADGVHLGPDDVPGDLARRLAPPGFLVGASVGSVEEVPRGAGADYWGIGPYRSTATKDNAGPALGASGLRDILGRLGPGQAGIAIGGIRPEDVSEIIAAGAAGVAVVSGILSGRTTEEVEYLAQAYAAHLP